METYQLRETPRNQSQASSPNTDDGFDYQSTYLTDDEYEHEAPRMRGPTGNRAVYSTYIKKYRFSRYKNALSSILPFRSAETESVSELPIDSVSCFANSSFSWVQRYLITAKTWTIYKTSTTTSYFESLISNSKLLVPKTPFNDSCEINGKRLLGLFKDEQQTRGRIKGSMFRVAWKFCSTRIILSSIIYALSIFIGLLGPVLFLRSTLQSMEREVDVKEEIYFIGTNNGTNEFAEIFVDHYNNMTNWNFLSADVFGIQNPNDRSNKLNAITLIDPSFLRLLIVEKSPNKTVTEFLRLEKDVQNEQLNRVGHSIGFVLCFFSAFYLKSITNWLNLRTASRLRSAVLSSVYRKSMESAISYNIATHQILTFANEESNAIFDLIENGALVIGTAIGVAFALGAAAILLDVPGIWPIFGILLLFPLLIILAKFSSYQYRRALFHSSKKLTVVEEICTNFKNIVILGFESIFIDRFHESHTNQYGCLRKSTILSSASFNGGVTSAILLGGLYLNWCDVVETNSLSVLVLIVIYAYFLKYLMIEFGESVQSILHGKTTLDKVMNSYGLTRPKPSRSRPPEPLVCSLRDAAFQWPKTPTSKPCANFQLAIDEFFIPKNQVIGVTGRSGSGKTSLMYSLLGHTQLIRGVVRQKDRLAFFPKDPLIIAGSLKENVVMGAEFNPQRYYTAVHALLLTEDVIVKTDSDEIPIGALELDRGQLERVMLARALYSDRQIFLFDEPLASIKDVMKSTHLIENVLDILLQAKKTVVLATQSNHLLAKCQKIYYLEDGKIYRDGTYYEFLNVAAFSKMIKEYEILRHSAGFDENLNGSNPLAVSVVKSTPNIIGHLRSSAAESTVNSEEMLLEKKRAKTSGEKLSLLSYISLFVICIASTFLYYLLPLGFIVVVKQKFSEPWLSYICVGVIVTSFFFDIFLKLHLAYVSENHSLQYNTKLFEKLCGTTINYLKTTINSDIVYWFNLDVFSAFQPYAVIIQSSIAILCSLVLLIIANCWTILLLPVLTVGFGLICHKVRYTMTHLYHKECESRQKLHMLMTNHIRCRIVLQSLDRVTEFCNGVHKVIEENTSAIFLRKSIKYYAQFLLNSMLVLVLSLVCLIVLLTPFSKLNPYRYILAIFGYYSFAYYLNRLLVDGVLGCLVSSVKLEFLESNLKKIEMIKSPLTSETIIDVNKGISLSFKDIICQFSQKKCFEVRKVHCRDGEVLGIIGKNLNCIIPLLHRVLHPLSGTIFLSAYDLQLFGNAQLRTLVGVVLADPITNMSMKNFLDPHANIATTDLTSALRTANLFERINKSMDDPVNTLSKSERQLLGLAKCLLTTPKIIILENIHPENQFVVDSCVRKHFKGCTILILGRPESLGACDKILEIDS